MHISVAAATSTLEQRGVLKRDGTRGEHTTELAAYMETLLGQPLPTELIDFYKERIASIGGYESLRPVWSDWYGGAMGDDDMLKLLLPAQAAPLFWDGNGSLFGLDLTSGAAPPAVYFFDHEDGFRKPAYAAGSCLGAFLLLFAEHDRWLKDGRPEKWELAIDPDIDKCPRAPPAWVAYSS